MTQHTSIGSAHQEELTGWWQAYLRRRYAVLFYSLLLTLVGHPIAIAIGMTGNFLQLFMGLNLLAAVLPGKRGKGRWVLLAILLAAVLIRSVSLWVGSVGLQNASVVLLAGIALFGVFSALRFALRASAITPEHLYAALSAYLLAGVFLGMVYASVAQVWPNSIIVSGGGASHPFSLANGIYFSFITLATVGYGDFVPGNDVVRGLAIVEAIAGQFYLAVMIARLMSLYMREAR
jgi:voltage-gated potassium channel